MTTRLVPEVTFVRRRVLWPLRAPSSPSEVVLNAFTPTCALHEFPASVDGEWARASGLSTCISPQVWIPERVAVLHTLSPGCPQGPVDNSTRGVEGLAAVLVTRLAVDDQSARQRRLSWGRRSGRRRKRRRGGVETGAGRRGREAEAEAANREGGTALVTSGGCAGGDGAAGAMSEDRQHREGRAGHQMGGATRAGPNARWAAPDGPGRRSGWPRRGRLAQTGRAAPRAPLRAPRSVRQADRFRADRTARRGRAATDARWAATDGPRQAGRVRRAAPDAGWAALGAKRPRSSVAD